MIDRWSVSNSVKHTERLAEHNHDIADHLDNCSCCLPSTAQLQLQGDSLKLVCLGSFLEEVVLVVEGVDEILETPQLKTQSLQMKREG